MQSVFGVGDRSGVQLIFGDSGRGDEPVTSSDEGRDGIGAEPHLWKIGGKGVSEKEITSYIFGPSSTSASVDDWYAGRKGIVQRTGGVSRLFGAGRTGSESSSPSAVRTVCGLSICDVGSTGNMTPLLGMSTTGIVTPTLGVGQAGSGGTGAHFPPFGEDGSTSLDWEKLNPLAEVFISTIHIGDDIIRNQSGRHEHLLNAKAREFTPAIPTPVGKIWFHMLWT